jgi:hypothetical protein
VEQVVMDGHVVVDQNDAETLMMFVIVIALKLALINVDQLHWVGDGIMAQKIPMVLISLMVKLVMENITSAKNAIVSFSKSFK